MNKPVDNGFADCNIAFIPYPAVPTNRFNYVQKITDSFILRASMISSNSLVCSLEAELIQYQIVYVPTDTSL